jgi:uncharacterized membrane protein
VPAAVIARTSPQVRLSAADDGIGAANRVVINPGCVNGELLIGIQSQSDGTAAAMTAPSATGFAWELRGSGGDATFGRMKVWYRTASNEPASWTFGGDGDGNVVVLVIPNWDTRGGEFLWDVEPTFNTGTSATQVSPTITMAVATNRLIRAWASESGGAAHSTAVDYTEHQDTVANAANSLSVQSQQTGPAGPTGTVNSTAGNVPYVAVAFALSSPTGQATSTGLPSVMTPYWSTASNALVAYVAANSAGSDDGTACKISSVIDDAHNAWIEVPDGTDFVAGFPGTPESAVRLSVWYCANAAAVRQITATATETCDSMALQILEASGVTNVSTVDASISADDNDDSAIVATVTTSVANDLIVGAAATGFSDRTLTHTTPNSFTDLGLITSDANTVPEDDVMMRCAYRVVGVATAYSTTWTVAPDANSVWSMIALKEGAPVTTNVNPNWPAMTHQIGFGDDPNDPDLVPTWTNVTTRALSFNTRRGRDYELTRTEAGEADVRMRNDDGALDPSNSLSIYSPNVKVFTPYRIRAVWNGTTYPLFTGYVERWPQMWDEEYGTSPLEGVDGFATLAATRLEGTLGAEILADEPHAYWPLDDGSLATTAANKSETTTDALVATRSANGGGTGSFNADLDLQGEESTCWRQTRSITATDDAPNSIYGTCLVGQLTLPQLSPNGILVETWAKISETTVGQDYGLIGLKASGFGSEPLRRVALLYMDSASGSVAVNVYSAAGVAQGFNSGVSGRNDGEWHHYVLHLTATTIQLWIDGVQQINSVLPSVPASTIDRIYIGGLADEFPNQNFAVGDFAHAAVYELAVADTRRIAVRANSGLFGFPEKSGARMSRLLNYAGWTGGRAIDEGLSLLGAANTIANQSLLAAVQDVANWENGIVFADSSGNFRFIDRANRFNQTTKWVFGEDEANGEIPYETDVQIDYDPKYVYNDVKITRAAGKTSSGNASARQRDQASIDSYFTRNLDKTSGVASVSQCEAEVDWVLENYAQPRLRLSRITIAPSANPDLWPVALGVEIGDRVTVRRRPFGSSEPIELDCSIEQIAHRVMPNRWETTFSLAPFLLTTYPGETGWILGASTLDVDTFLG